ncbi:MAG: dienelactone hydrolase family protein [Alphaproteobacteria bacterium]|nr:dienelactone hydrolase family protein [Alphaproteobacteria bacterium]
MTDIVTRHLNFEAEPGVHVAGYAAMPRAAEGRPAVLVLSEIWGVNANMRAICERLAREGIIGFAMDLYRGERPPAYADPLPQVLGYFARYDDPRGIRDCRAATRFLAEGGLGPRPGRIVPWGFCKGGRFAHYLAATDGRVAAAINFYGRVDFPRDEVLKPFTPLDLAGLIAVPYLGLFAERDALITRESVTTLRDRLAGRGAPHHIHIYAGAEHAFFNDERPSYSATVAADAWAKVRALVVDGRLP